MTEEPIDLTALMSLDPLDLTKQDLDKLITYQRKLRMHREAGGRTKKATGEAPAVDIKALMNKIVKPAAPATPQGPSKGFIRRL